MSKKANLRQTQIVTLTDYHQKQIEDINQDKENMLKECQQKKEGILSKIFISLSFNFVELRSQLIHKEQLLIEAKQNLEAMNEYQVFIFKIKLFFFFLNQTNSIGRKLNNNKMMK